jgi:hypothetical protein
VSNIPLHYASGVTARRKRWRPWLVTGIVLLAYLGSYLFVRRLIEPAANLAYFAYKGDSEAVDICCYYGYWPLYKVDRLLTGRKHYRDRTPPIITDDGP